MGNFAQQVKPLSRCDIELDDFHMDMLNDFDIDVISGESERVGEKEENEEVIYDPSAKTMFSSERSQISIHSAMILQEISTWDEDRQQSIKEIVTQEISEKSNEEDSFKKLAKVLDEHFESKSMRMQNNHEQQQQQQQYPSSNSFPSSSYLPASDPNSVVGGMAPYMTTDPNYTMSMNNMTSPSVFFVHDPATSFYMLRQYFLASDVQQQQQLLLLQQQQQAYSMMNGYSYPPPQQQQQQQQVFYPNMPYQTPPTGLSVPYPSMNPTPNPFTMNGTNNNSNSNSNLTTTTASSNTAFYPSNNNTMNNPFANTYNNNYMMNNMQSSSNDNSIYQSTTINNNNNNQYYYSNNNNYTTNNTTNNTTNKTTNKKKNKNRNSKESKNLNRGNYHCGKCGQQKVNHVCQFVDVVSVEIGVQVEAPLIDFHTGKPFRGQKYLVVGKKKTMMDNNGTGNNSSTNSMMENSALDEGSSISFGMVTPSSNNSPRSQNHYNAMTTTTNNSNNNMTMMVSNDMNDSLDQGLTPGTKIDHVSFNHELPLYDDLAAFENDHQQQQSSTEPKPNIDEDEAYQYFCSLNQRKGQCFNFFCF
jgi:hypothetical protein